MKKSTIVLLAAIIISTFSCSKKNNDSGVTSETLEIKVVNGHTGAAESGATVNLYVSSSTVTSISSPAYSSTTGQDGSAKITVDIKTKYYVIVTSPAGKNYYSGLIPVGIFKTQADIDSSAAQIPKATIGSIKFQDTNGDGIISQLDDVPAPTITLTGGANDQLTTTVY